MQNLFVSLVVFVGCSQAVQINPFKKYTTSAYIKPKAEDNYLIKSAPAPIPILIKSQPISHTQLLPISHAPLIALHQIPAPQIDLQHLQLDEGGYESGKEDESEGDEKEASYEFSYSVSDEKTGDIKNQKESRKGDIVEGSYDLIDADGYKRTVEYRSEGKKGFTAVVKREPTDIKIEQPSKAEEGGHILLQHQPIILQHQPLPLVHYAPSKRVQQIKYLLSDISLKDNRKNDLLRRKDEEEELEKARVEYNSPHAAYRY